MESPKDIDDTASAVSAPITASEDSTHDDVASTQLTTFHPFARLPAELRLIVWKQFALPRGPMYRKKYISLPFTIS